jgi:DNA-binding response OmpR family regulator
MVGVIHRVPGSLVIPPGVIPLKGVERMLTPFANGPSTLPTALVVDANSSESEKITHCLEPFYRILKATALGEAMQYLQRALPAIVVLDPDLPDGDGIEWLRYLRTNPATQAVVVACVTHRSSVREKVTGFLAGADDYLIYPIDPETFAYRVALLSRIGRR